MTCSCINIRQTFIRVTGIARDFSISNQIWCVMNSVTAGAIEEINSTNELSDVVRPSFEANRGSDTLRLSLARDLRAVTSITLTTSEARKSHETSAGSCNVQSGSSDFKPERFIGRTKGKLI